MSMWVCPKNPDHKKFHTMENVIYLETVEVNEKNEEVGQVGDVDFYGYDNSAEPYTCCAICGAEAKWMFKQPKVEL